MTQLLLKKGKPLMYLKKVKNKETGRIYLSIVQSYRDSSSKYPKSTTIKSLGYLDELEKKYDDPIAYFNKQITQMNEQNAINNLPVTFSIGKDERISADSTNRKNFGYTALNKIYHELEIDKFLRNSQRHLKIDYDANAIMKLLVFSRLLYPASKKKTYENKGRFFERSNFSLDDVYRSLLLFYKYRDALQLWLHRHIKKQYQRNTKLVYYDLTNYYFEIDEEDEIRKRGISKEHRPNPIVQMGLFMDIDGIPITYKLFPGNTPDKITFIPMLGKIQHDYSLGRIIVVADRGITAGDNIWYTLSAKNGYVFSYSVRAADKKFQDYVLAERGYRDIGDNFKIKSRLYPREIRVSTTDGKKIKKIVDEKQVIFYSSKHAAKAKRDRTAALQKARDLIKNPARYHKSTAHGAAKYIKNLTFDSKTGEILEQVGQSLIFDEERLREEERLDGYYAIITSEYKEPAEKIIEIYRGLWRIEEAFKITKSNFETRPVYLSLQKHIESHFLICFIALVIARILAIKLEGKYSVTTMIESLRKASCSHIQENYFLFDYYDDVLSDIGKKLKIDFGKKCIRLGEIKKILAGVKKR